MMRVLLTWQAVIHFRIIVVFAQSNLSGLDVVTPSVMAQLPLPGVGGVGPCQDQLELYIVSSGGFIYNIYIYTYIHTPFLPQSWFSGKWLCFPWFPFLWFQVLFHWTMILGERVIQYQDDFMDPNTKGMFLHWRRIFWMMKTPQGQRRCFAKFWYPKMDGLYWKTFLKWMIWGETPLFSETSTWLCV